MTYFFPSISLKIGTVHLMEFIVGRGISGDEPCSVQIPESIAFELWRDHYAGHLKRLYEIFQLSGFGNNIDLTTFERFVYDNSSKFITAWS